MILQNIKKAIRNTSVFVAIERFKTIQSLRQWTAHDQEMLEFYSGFIGAGELCFDVGANIGNRVKIFLKIPAVVIAVEPQQECAGILRSVFGGNRNLTIVQKALGAAEGEAEMNICNASTISSLSREWIDSVKKSGRFSEYDWDKKQVISLTTLDTLIGIYGCPAFIKIDVEGFEYQVIQGLTQPVKTLSLEFTPEFIGSTFNCIDHLQALGDIRLNYTTGESMQFALEDWVTPEKMKAILADFSGDNQLFGDVYIRFLKPEGMQDG